jgi:tRNA(Ile)-lysidine synthase
MDERDKMLRAAREEGLWGAGDRIVVAVSGGPDSMALLHMLSSVAKEEEITLIAAHVNHGFRVQESAHELQVVENFARQLGIPCETIQLDLPSYIEETGRNSQAAAREKRYAFLHEIAGRYGASRIALAHHGDDQAETVLMRLLRGTGLAGLAGIHSKRFEKNVELIRPMLRMNKSGILRYCETYHIPYCEDSSNRERHYFRNIIRLDILPYLSQYNPQLPQSLQRLADVAAAEDGFMEERATALFAGLVTQSPDGCALQCADLLGLHVALQRRLIKLILSYLCTESEKISFDQIETMRQAAANHMPGTWRMDAGAQVRCVREYDVMRWFKLSPSATAGEVDYFYEIGKEQRYLELKQGNWVFEFAYVEQSEGALARPSSRYEAVFDEAGLSCPLVVRNRRPGDRIQVLGLNGSKKVQDIFVDEKLAPLARGQYPLLCDAEGRLLWIPGIRRSGHALAGGGAGRLLRIRARNE